MLEYIIAFIMLCLVLYLAYFSTKWLGKQMQFKSISKYMQVIDKVYIDRDKVVLIVKFQDTYKALAMSSNAITDLGDLVNFDESQSFEEEPKVTFSELYTKYKNIQSIRKSKKDSSGMRDGIDE